jgi:tRNA wybutosine-synthesizing protein 4
MWLAEFCLLEQLLPSGPDHPFAKTMLAHFDKLKTSLRSVHRYQTLDSQGERFHSRGWQHVDLCDLWEAWSGDDFISPEERRVLDNIEPFDEWEELVLFGRHYLVLHATAAPSPNEHPEKRRLREEPRPSGLNIGVTPHGTPCKTLKRRFGNAASVSNVEGQIYGVHMLGLGENARSETYDVYALSHTKSPSLRLPLSGPLPRMCSTSTDLGSYGVLLTGGRSSPAKAMSDCWLLKRGPSVYWTKIWDLPKPLYRHSAVRLPNSSLALVVGGKTGPADVSSNAFVLHPEKGWLTCQLLGTGAPIQVFGAALVNASKPAVEHGVFEGMLSGGMKQDGTLNCDAYWWRLELTDAEQPKLTLNKMDVDNRAQSILSVFGSSVVDLGSSAAICGGVGDEPSIQGQHVALLQPEDGKVGDLGSYYPPKGSTEWPFMVGSSVLARGRQLTVFGGGAVCFSMGSYWESRSWDIELLLDSQGGYYSGLGTCEYLESPKVLGKAQDETESRQNGAEVGTKAKATITLIPRVHLTSGEDFRRYLQDGKPVVIEGLNIGDCLEKWTPAYMVEQVGKEKKVCGKMRSRITETAPDELSRWLFTSAVKTARRWTSTPRTFSM